MRLLLAVVLLAPLAACGLGDKAAFADRVTAAPAVARERGSVAGSITLGVALTKAPVEVPTEGTVANFGTPFVADLLAGRSHLERTQLVHDGLVVHLRRSDAEVNDARPWLTLDIAELPDSAGIPFVIRQNTNLPLAAFTLPPSVLVDLIGGALTGSLRDLGRSTIGGVAVRGYSGRFDLDKMLNDTGSDDYAGRRGEDVQHAFEIVDVPGKVHAGAVWLDKDGFPRRFRVTFEQKPRRRWTFAVTMTVDLAASGAPVDIDVPNVDESIRISSLSRLVNEIGASFS